MLLSNSTDPPAAGIPFSVNFDGPVDYVIFIFQLAFATSTVLLAGPVLVAIAATRALRLQNRFIFMLNTSVCDTLLGLSMYYVGLFDVREEYPSRNGTHGMLQNLLGVNIWVFLFAQLDRYLAICHPFFYMRFVTRQVIISINVLCWVGVYGQATIAIYLPPYTRIQMFVFGIYGLQVIVFTKVAMTVKLYFVAKFQLARDPPSADKESNKESLRIIIFVVISFLILWYPSLINIILRLMGGGGLSFRNGATNAFAIVARFSSICTPAVYLWGSAALRKAVVSTVWGKVCPRCKAKRVSSCPVKGKS